MHDSKLAHRDIKPENILYQNLENEFKYKISDYGISK